MYHAWWKKTKKKDIKFQLSKSLSQTTAHDEDYVT